MNRFRELEYLNLALNNIERIEGLETCEALTKLDLTANFIVNLTSITTLVELSSLKELYLTGNPCTEFRGYRPWVLNHLQQLQELDGKEVLRSERIKSLQKFQESSRSIEEDQLKAIEKRNLQKRRYQREKKQERHSANSESEEDDSEIDRWQNEMTENSPEVRIQMHEEIQQRRERSERRDVNQWKQKKPVKYFTSTGEPLNLNRANLDFHFQEDEQKNAYILEVKTYKYLDVSHLTCDVQPKYVRVLCKGEPLQIVYPSEVRSDQSTALRSQVTGHLVITALKVEESQIIRFDSHPAETNEAKNNEEQNKSKKKTQFLEFDQSFKDKLKVTTKNEVQMSHRTFTRRNQYNLPQLKRPDSPGFKDDPEVPPLE